MNYLETGDWALADAASSAGMRALTEHTGSAITRAAIRNAVVLATTVHADPWLAAQATSWNAAWVAADGLAGDAWLQAREAAEEAQRLHFNELLGRRLSMCGGA
jgi:hypothetical protein